MRFIALRLCIGLIFTSGHLVQAFENLDFESAMPALTGGQDDIFQLTEDVLPFWTPYGFDPDFDLDNQSDSYGEFSNVYFNGGHVGGAPTIFNVFGEDGIGFVPTPTQGPIEGNYSLQIYTLYDSGALYQTGLVPSFSKSIRFYGDILDVRTFHDWVTGYPQWANQPAASLAVTLW